MDPRVIEANDIQVKGDSKATPSAWHEEACAWMCQRPDKTQVTDKVAAKVENPETPEVKAAYQSMLEKTKGVDPVAVADSIRLFGDLAATGTNVSSMKGLFQKDNVTDKAVDPNVTVNPDAVQPEVAKAYSSLLQRGFNPVLIVDVLNVAGDVAAIAMSPQGKKLFEDIKTLIGHIRG